MMNTESYASGVFTVKPVILLGTEGVNVASTDTL